MCTANWVFAPSVLSGTKRRAPWSLAKPASLPAQVNASSLFHPSPLCRRLFTRRPSWSCHALEVKDCCLTLQPLPQTLPVLVGRQTWCQTQKVTPHDGSSSSPSLPPKIACLPSLSILICTATSVHGTNVWPLANPVSFLARGISACGSAILVCIGGVRKPESLFSFSCVYLVR
jgi:hypothetical protein